MLFEATWIRRPAAARAGSAATLDWRGVQTPTDLEQWSECHGLDVLLPALLESDDLRFYGARSADAAGLALNRSSGVVGVSHMFAGSADLITVWSDLVVVAARMYPGFDLGATSSARTFKPRCPSASSASDSFEFGRVERFCLKPP